MLYKLTIPDNGTKDLETLPFLDFADLGKIEKDLEVLLVSTFLMCCLKMLHSCPFFKKDHCKQKLTYML